MNTIGNQNIQIKLRQIEKQIENIETKLDKAIEMLENNNKDCKKMITHIDFVDGVYENIKAPMNYICNSINNTRLIGDKSHDKS